MASILDGRPAPEQGAALGRGVALIVVVGVALGVAQNVLMRRGEDLVGLKDYQRRSLAWVKQDVVLPELADLPTTGQPAVSVDPAPEQPSAADVAPPPAPEAGPVAAQSPPAATPPDDGTAPAPLPMIPNLPHPIEMQLAAVKAFFDQDAAAIIDARTPEEFAEGHIPGAVNMPFDEAVTDPARLESFDAQGRPIIIYCGGGTCDTSRNLAFAMLQAGQQRLLIFMGGYPEWTEAGYPVVTAARAGRTS